MKDNFVTLIKVFDLPQIDSILHGNLGEIVSITRRQLKAQQTNDFVTWNPCFLEV